MPELANDIRVNSWAQLQDELFEDAWNGDLGRFRSRYAFRGLSDSAYRLETTLMRLGGPYQSLERHLLRNFKKYARSNVVEQDSVWHWLAVAQHYGLPTRLLDWTYSPYVALHFATANIERFATDGVIWAVNYLHTHQLLPRHLMEKLEEEGANVFTVEMLSATLTSLQEFSAPGQQNFALFFEPPSIDDRITNQYALFSVMPDPVQALDSWLAGHPGLWRRIIIPAPLKWEIRDKLDQANISERVLFPGLDGLSSWLKRQYSPKQELGRLTPARVA
ncbi:FRG domain-containing protein [Pelobacter seleniigenes]|uniref:FRG domain-containing protein n=1 Tax=Pelobacter seleniigenes TaxID=407188 RepID=UPI0005686CD4|nr:FRG domain-containing protein [Pelobacter seleniigenes]